jgi:protein O-mannosyl-transferase
LSLTAATRQQMETVAQTMEAPTPWWKQKFFLAAALAVLVLGFYSPAIRNGFVVFDDSLYLSKNQAIHGGLSVTAIKWAFTTSMGGNWHPLTWLAHAFDWQLFGPNPAGHHAVSVLLHAANAALLFLILEAATGLLWPSLFVAAIFALHPLNVESVAWAAELKNVISMFFGLLALGSYTKYARSHKRGFYISTLIFFALGLMAKPQIIPLPFLLLLWDYWPLDRLERSAGKRKRAHTLSFLIREKTPLFVLAALSAIITMTAQRSADAVHGLGQVSLISRLENCVVSYVQYLGSMFWPVKLVPMYPHPAGALPVWQVVASGVVLLVITGVVIWQRKHRYLLMGWLWFLGTLVPMIGLVQVGEQARADRYMYLPMVGILIAIVWAVRNAAEEKHIAKRWLAAPAVLAVIALGTATVHQLARWRDGETLWRYTLSVTQQNYMAHDNLAMVFAEEGRADEAIAEFRAAESLHQYPAPQILNLALYEQNHGHLAGAIEQYEQAAQSSNDPAVQAAAWDQEGAICVLQADWGRAKQFYEKSLNAKPNDADALAATGVLAQKSGDFQLAVRRLERMMDVAPTDVGLVLLASALRQSGRDREADVAIEKVQRLSPNFARAQKVASQYAASFGIVLH